MSLLQELKRRNVIRVAGGYLAAAWLVFQVFETVLPVLGLSDNVTRVALIILMIGFLPAVVGAWVFEWTPAGLKFDHEVDQAAADGVASSRKLDRIILVVLVLAVGFFAVDKFVFDPARDLAREQAAADAATDKARKGFYGDRSIAVLPFVNMSSDPEQQFFAEGISEEVLNLLAQIRELRVISRSSAFAFKGQNLEIPEIADRLDVAHVLEGSVRKFGDDIRVTAQLIEARTDRHLWSETFDRKYKDVFALQDEIAATVAEQLKITLLDPPKSQLTDPKVRALTQQAKQISESRPDGTGARMYLLLSEALAIDPDYVPALEWLSVANYFRMEEGLITQEEVDNDRVRLKNRILELDPSNGPVLAYDAWDRAFNHDDLEGAAHLYEMALAKNAAHSNSVRLAGAFARRIGQMDTAIALGKHSVAIDPLCYMCLYHLSRTFLYAGDITSAEEVRERYIVLSESGGKLHYALVMTLNGKPAAALEYLAAIEAPNSQVISMMAIASFESGEVEGANQLLDKLIQGPATGEDALLVAEAAAWMGKNDMAFEWMAMAWDQHDDRVTDTVFLPTFRRLHDDPRWSEWRELIGMSERRLAAIAFNPELPE